MSIVTATTLIFGSDLKSNVRQGFIYPTESQLRSILSKTKDVLIQTEKQVDRAHKQTRELNPINDWVGSTETWPDATKELVNQCNWQTVSSLFRALPTIAKVRLPWYYLHSLNGIASYIILTSANVENSIISQYPSGN